MSLVSIICLCYNQAPYVEEAIESVFSQDYKEIELLVVNDGSSDDSNSVIEGLKLKYPSIIYINHVKNQGMCKSFNEALAITKGDYIIDLAADDIMLPNRISLQAEAFEKLDERYGVVFSDAFLVDEKKNIQGTFYKRNPQGQLLQVVSEGDVFEKVVHHYQICSPTIMVRARVMKALGGYDENLSYEDYDFFIRSSRNYLYKYIDYALLYKRELKISSSSDFYEKRTNRHLASTLIVCKKALWLCKTDEEKKALLHSIRYHYRQSYFLGNYKLAEEYFRLIEMMKESKFKDSFLWFMAKCKIPVSSLYVVYRKVKKILS